MTGHDFVSLNVFAESRFGGNPLAVVRHAEGLSSQDMQSIARDFNLSETVFILPPQDPRHTAQARIFSPKGELPFAGHPSVGAGFLLAREGNANQSASEHLVLEQQAGLVRIQPMRDPQGQVIGASIAAPHSLQLGTQIPSELLAACVGLQIDDLVLSAHHPVSASVGTSFIFAEVKDEATLHRACADTAGFRHAAQTIVDLNWQICLYTLREGDITRPRIRVFIPALSVPALSIIEDPATGSAAAGLAALLTSLAPGDDVDLHFDIAQGEEIGRPSRLFAQARKSAEGPVTARVAGQCVITARGHIDL